MTSATQSTNANWGTMAEMLGHDPGPIQFHVERRERAHSTPVGGIWRMSAHEDTQSVQQCRNVRRMRHRGGAADGRSRRRSGRFVALAGAGGQMLYDYGHGTQVYRGAHGGLSPDEMLVPLIVVPGY